MSVVRATLAAGALLVAGWLALGARAAHDLDAAAQVAGQLRVAQPGETAEARRRLDRADRWTPDRRVDVERAKLEARDGRRDRAAAILRDVVAAEPRNAEAWAWLATITEPVDPAASARARARLRELVPRVAAR